jgi:hypothetical protein
VKFSRERLICPSPPKWDFSWEETDMSRLSRVTLLTLVVAMCCSFVSVVRAADDNTVTAKDVIAGTMNITFNTRTNLDTSGDLKDGSPALGAKDQYHYSLKVAMTTEYDGDIFRQPKLYSSILKRTKQDGLMSYNTYIKVFNPANPAQSKDVGKWVGDVKVDPTSGAYDLSGMRYAIDAVGRAQAFNDSFGGRLIGKAEKKESLSSYTYKRLVGDKTVEITVKKTDPMTFDNIELAKGPAEVYPHTSVTGRLDYDYETGNYLTDGIHFKYNLNGKDFEDVITGTIKWVEDPDRATNGKGHYDFNLRFNEDKNKGASNESAAFANMSQEDAFFAVDNSVPCLTGTVEYVDTFISGGTTPSASKVVYHLDANKLTKQQIVNFYKLWMVCVGPTNDE